MRISDWSSDVCSSDLDPGKRQEEAEMIGELGEGAGDRFAGKQILCLERFAIRRQNELGFGPRRGGAGPKCIQLGGHIASVGDGNVDVAGLQDAANVRIVRRPGPELSEGSFLISERL